MRWVGKWVESLCNIQIYLCTKDPKTQSVCQDLAIKSYRMTIIVTRMPTAELHQRVL